MIKKNYKKAKKKFFIYPNVKSIDQMLCFSLFMALFIFIGKSGQVNLAKCLVFCIAGTLVIDMVVRFYRGKNHLKKYASEEAVMFNSSIEEVTLALYDNDFRLKNEVGEFYIFCSKFVILPKCEAVVSVQGNKCLLHARKGRVVQLCEIINFEDVTADSNQDSKNYGK